jgi:hypothetical protein
MKEDAEIWPRMAAKIDHHFAMLGVEETYRRAGVRYPSGELRDADGAEPDDEAAA